MKPGQARPRADGLLGSRHPTCPTRRRPAPGSSFVERGSSAPPADAPHTVFTAHSLRGSEQLRESLRPAHAGALHVFATHAACGCRRPPAGRGASGAAGSVPPLARVREPDARPPRAGNLLACLERATSRRVLSGGPQACAVCTSTVISTRRCSLQ